LRGVREVLELARAHTGEKRNFSDGLLTARSLALSSC
jgi:hypothetical protein